MLEVCLYESTSIICQIHSNGSDQFLAATFLPLQVVPTTSKECFRVSSLQPTCLPVAHEDDEAPCYYMFSAAELSNMLALAMQFVMFIFLDHTL